MKKIKSRKVNFNRNLYGNVLEANPREKKIDVKDVIEEKSTYMLNFVNREDAVRKALRDDDLLDEEVFNEFALKCEKELFNYIRYSSITGSFLLKRGTYDAGERNFYDITVKRKKRKNTMHKITPSNNILEFFHALLEDYIGTLVTRYITLYSIQDKKAQKDTYKTLMLKPHDIDELLFSSPFSIEKNLKVDYETFRNVEILDDEKDEKRYEVFETNSTILFNLHDILTTEDVVPWNKDYSIKNSFGLYQLLNSIWMSEVRKLYIKLLLPPNVSELNNKHLESDYFDKKIYKNQESDLFKAVIPEKIYEATPKISNLVLHMSDLFQNTFNEMYKIVIDVSTINTVRDRREQTELKNAKDNFKKEAKENITEKLSKEINKYKEKCEQLEKENNDLKIKYNEVEKSTSKSKIKALEKQHKDDLKKLRAVTAEKNKKEKEYQERIEILEQVNAEEELSVLDENDTIIKPVIPQDCKIAFCMQDKPGFEQPAKALLDEFPNSIIAYSPAQITNQDVAVYLTEMMGHPLYYAFKKAVEKTGCFSWHTMTKNPKLIREKLAIYLTKKGVIS